MQESGRTLANPVVLPGLSTEIRSTRSKCRRAMRARQATRPPAVCRFCGASIEAGRSYCASCGVTVSRENLIEVAKLGRIAGHSPEARARQAEKQRRHAAELKAWNPSNQPNWLTEKFYRGKIQPRLSGITVPAIHRPWGFRCLSRRKFARVGNCHISGTGRLPHESLMYHRRRLPTWA